MTFILDLFSVFVVIPTIQFPQKIVSMLLCSWYSWRWKCDSVWGPCWNEFTDSDYCDILIWTKKSSNTHALSTSCPQINVTHPGMNGIMASLLHGATCWVVWLAGHPEI